MNLPEYLVIGVVGLILAIGVAQAVRGHGGARAERRFWIRLILALVSVAAASVAIFWLVPESYQRFAFIVVSVISIFVTFFRYEQPSA